MIQLLIYPYNQNGYGDDYVCQNLYFKDFYIGKKRDEKNLGIIRTFTDGTILLKNPDDFDMLEQYFDLAQDCSLKIDDVWHNGRVTFIDPDFTAKSVQLSVEIFDQYSKLIDGKSMNSQQSDNEPYVKRKHFVSDMEVEKVFVDGSSYMYGDLWGVERITKEETKDIDIEKIMLWNKGGEVEIDELVAGYDLMAYHWIPEEITYTDKQGSRMRHVSTKWVREFRYFPDVETIPEGWSSVPGTMEVNGIAYSKYARRKDGTEDKWFQDNENYWVGDFTYLSTPYIYVVYFGYSTDLQKSANFCKVNDLIEQLIMKATYIERFKNWWNTELWVASLKNYNEYVNNDAFNLELFIDVFRNKFGMYFRILNDIAEMKLPDWNTNQLLDLSNYMGRNWMPINKPKKLGLPKTIVFTGNSNRLDFADQVVSFYGYLNDEDSITEPIITDVEEKGDSADSYILINTQNASRDQIYEKFRYIDDRQNGTEAIYLAENGKLIAWNSDKLESSTWLDFKVQSNNIYDPIGSAVKVTFSYWIYAGYVKVELDEKNWIIGTPTQEQPVSGTITGNFDCGGESIKALTIELVDVAYPRHIGHIYNIKVEPITKIPNTSICPITGLAQLNGPLSTSSCVKDWRVPMSYVKGYLKGYGTIYPQMKFMQEIEVKLPLQNDIFDDDTIFRSYVAYDSKKYCIFVRKRQILTETQVSQFDHLIMQTNEVS